jgi:hypothetical protein
MSANTLPLVLVIILSILLSVGQFFIPSFGKNKYISVIIRIFLFIYIVQLSTIVHELTHAYIGLNGEVNIPGLFYVPFIGFIKSNDVRTSISNKSDMFKTSIAGFIAHIIYLILMGLIFFKGNPLAIAIISTGFIMYIFIYLTLMKGNPANDFYAMTH